MKPLSERTDEDVLQWDKQGCYWGTDNGEEWSPNEMLVYATQLEWQLKFEKQLAIAHSGKIAALKREYKGLLGIVSAYHPEYLRGCDCPQCSDALLTA